MPNQPLQPTAQSLRGCAAAERPFCIKEVVMALGPRTATCSQYRSNGVRYAWGHDRYGHRILSQPRQERRATRTSHCHQQACGGGSDKGSIPHWHYKMPLGGPAVGTYQAFELDNFERRWAPHPDPNVDLCAMPIAPHLI